jgi:hypothetical protein
MEEDITKAPKASRLDAAYHAVKIVLGAAGQVAGVALGVPVSVPASDFLAALLDPPVSKQKDDWVRLIAERLVVLEEKAGELNLEDLQRNERFVSAVLQATNIAMRTHHREKLEALANAVMRMAAPAAAGGESPSESAETESSEPSASSSSSSAEEATSHIFMHLVDRLTPAHMSLLSYVRDEGRWMESRGADGAHVEDGWVVNFDEAFPEFKGKRFVFYAVIQDLLNLGLLREKPDESYRLDSLLGSAYGAEPSDVKRERAAARREDMKRRNLIEFWNLEVTGLGKAFLNYLSDPLKGGEGDADPRQV